jgi:hypothetical protein
MPARKRAPKKTAPKKKAAPKRVAVGGLRTLGDVEPSSKAAKKHPKRDEGLAKKARATLQKEFDAALALKEKLAAEAAIGSKEKGRDSLRQTEKLRSLVSSLEGMNRFAMAMGLITPAESRELYAAAMKRGLYEGWR